MQRGRDFLKLFVLLCGSFVLLAACASTKPFLGFLATTGYVDQKMQTQSETNKKSLDKIESDLNALQADVSKFQDQSSQIKQLMDEIDATKSQTEQLQKLASTVGDQIAALPRATLLQLADMIQKSLAQQSAGSAPAQQSGSPTPAK